MKLNNHATDFKSLLYVWYTDDSETKGFGYIMLGNLEGNPVSSGIFMCLLYRRTRSQIVCLVGIIYEVLEN